ncbi:unnamed protein product, partial [Didymodactylos carnosus]
LACGYAHVLALASDGSVFTWGSNTFGQLGYNNKTNGLTPQRINLSIRIVEILASNHSHLSCGLSSSNEVYMWGFCKSHEVLRPLLTKFTSMTDVFGSFAQVAVSPKMLYSTEKTPHIPLLESISKSFNNPALSDIIFVVGDEHIYVNKYLLKIRSQYFNTLFGERWTKSTDSSMLTSTINSINPSVEKIVVKEQYSPSVYRSFLNYFYTDKIIVKSEDVLELLELANYYCEPQVKIECERIIKQSITIDNALALYQTSIQHQADDLREHCLKFCLNNLTAVCHTDAFQSLDSELLKNIMLKACEHGIVKT